MNPASTYQRRLFFYALLAVLIGIWGRVIYSVYEKMEAGVDAAAGPDSIAGGSRQLSPAMETERLPYEAGFRDPFMPAAALFYKPRPVSSRTSLSVKPEPAIAEPPPLILQGITGTTATLNGSENEVYFVRPGDSVDGVKILEVKRDHVLARIANKTFPLNLRR